VLVASLVLPACGSDAPTATVRIGVIAPLSGGLAASGLGIRNSVELAIRQANRQHRVKGWRIGLATEDDQARPEVGAGAATRLSDNPEVAAVVGTLTSTVAERVAPILDSRKVVTISPANTDPTLTRGTDGKNPVRPFGYYFRLAATDLVQGPFDANFAYRAAGKRTAAVVHDGTDYGHDLALQFKAQFEKLGGRVPIVEAVRPEETDFSALLTRLKRSNPDLVYYGGEYQAAARLTSQADQQGLRAPLMSGYAIVDPAYLEAAQQAAVGDLATGVAASADGLPAARPFVDAYRAAGYVDPPEVYGAYAYDAANAVIAALARVLPGTSRITDDVRARLRQAVQDSAVDGVTGKIAFDRYGDTTTHSLTVYKVETDGSGKPAWKPQETSQIDAATWE
jgi:branched-chain amino acid transport system substrate-binding protein